MIVVIIVGVLATIATYAVRKYILSAKTSEAISMITSIKAAQEGYKAETFVYLDVSGNFDNLYPMRTPGRQKVMWGGDGDDATVAARWRILGVQADAPVQFGYATVATRAGQQLPEPGTERTFGFPSNEPAYAVVARGDVNGDGKKFQYVVGHSFNAELYVENEGE
jgi:Tfp pilus assembly major pilin PilA